LTDAFAALGAITLIGPSVGGGSSVGIKGLSLLPAAAVVVPVPVAGGTAPDPEPAFLASASSCDAGIIGACFAEPHAVARHNNVEAMKEPARKRSMRSP
jgi:hypothetical protein